MRSWTFLTNHALVLLLVDAENDLRVRDIAARLHITERCAQGILTDLCDSGHLIRTRVGRRNSYQVACQQPLRHPTVGQACVRDLLSALQPAPAV